MSRWMLGLVLGAALALGAGVAALGVGKKSLREARKLLARIELVDGAGSGLDADTLRGMSPEALTAGRLVVRDSAGALVGPVLDTLGGSVLSALRDTELGVVRSLDGVAVRLPAASTGFVETGLALQYQSTDCSGAPLVSESAGATSVMIAQAQVHGSTAFFATGTVSTMTLRSREQSLDQASCTGAGGTFIAARQTCCIIAQAPDDFPAAAVATLDLGTLGLVPPFHVEGP